MQKNPDCDSRDRALNLIYTVGAFTSSVVGVFVGMFLDKFGPRVTVMVCVCAGGEGDGPAGGVPDQLGWVLLLRDGSLVSGPRHCPNNDKNRINGVTSLV